MKRTFPVWLLCWMVGTGMVATGMVGTGMVVADDQGLDQRMARPSGLSNEDWQLIESRMALLNNISYLPSLLPVIMQNRHSLELTQQQIASLRQWRKENYQRMVEIMNTIIAKRIVLAQRAVDPDVNQDELIVLQDELFRLQRQVFRIRLSCRELVTGTFTEEQWSNFAFIAAEDPKIAGLIGQ